MKTRTPGKVGLEVSAVDLRDIGAAATKIEVQGDGTGAIRLI